jgi:hypothetical protein
MKRPATLRNLAAISVLAMLLAASGSASAAILSFGCMGKLGNQMIVFNRDGLYIADAKMLAGKRKKFTADTVDDAISALKNAKESVIEFGSDGVGDLDETPIQFSLTGDNKKTQKAVFTHVSSKRLSHKHRTICGRDEDTDLYRSIYRYERDGEPPRGIKMQCFYYQLSTRGGRKGCGDD